MKSPHTRTYFFAALIVLLAYSFSATGQTTNGAPATARTPQGRGGGVVAPPQVEWREFKSEAGGFSVKFPSVPRVERVSFNKGPLELVRHTHMASLGDAAHFEVD